MAEAALFCVTLTAFGAAGLCIVVMRLLNRINKVEKEVKEIEGKIHGE